MLCKCGNMQTPPCSRPSTRPKCRRSAPSSQNSISCRQKTKENALREPTDCHSPSRLLTTISWQESSTNLWQIWEKLLSNYPSCSIAAASTTWQLWSATTSPRSAWMPLEIWFARGLFWSINTLTSNGWRNITRISRRLSSRWGPLALPSSTNDSPQSHLIEFYNFMDILLFEGFVIINVYDGAVIVGNCQWRISPCWFAEI